MTFVGVLILLVVGVGSTLFVGALKELQWKLALGVAVAVSAALATLAAYAPEQEAKAPTVAAPAATRPVAAPQSVDVTLQNYRRSGDNIALECSGTTGNVVCKPRK